MLLLTRLVVGDYFLSPTNPLATTEQRNAEALAIRIFNSEGFKARRKPVEHRWRSLVGKDPNEEAWGRFDSFMEECAFAAILKAINSDPNFPKVVRIVMPPHEWFGMKVPGSRFGGGPGIDQSYAFVPVDYGARYELTGQWIGAAPADHIYILAGNPSMTNVLDQLARSQLEVDEQGRFTITVDPESASGRPNHIQTKPGAQYLFIRDCRSDWRQTATALRVKRLDPPTRLPWTEEQIEARAGELMFEDAPAMYVWMRYFDNLTLNVVGAPFGTGSLGGLVAQMVAFARVRLSETDAYIVTVDPANADFHDIQLNDFWFNSVGDYVGRTASFNNAQSARSADGRIVYVISVRDPGVHNWLDPNGLHDLLMIQRWQRIPDDRTPAISGQLVPFSQLDEVLGPDIPRLDRAGRRSQILEREATYQLRLVDS